MTSETVRQAGAVEDMNHREPRFQELLNEVREALPAIYPQLSDYRPYLIGGSGTAAVEAMLTSVVHEGPVLVIENGYYSARIADILEVHGIAHKRLAFDWMAGAVLEPIAAELATGEFEAVVATHNETTTGRLIDLDGLAQLCEGRAKLLVDAMSSFGGDNLSVRPAALCSSANKCLHGLPGVSFVLLDPAKAHIVAKPRTFYLDLRLYEGEAPPLTPPVPAMAAFRQALREFVAEGGQPARLARYARQTDALRATLESLGLACPIPRDESSVSLVLAEIPAGYGGDKWLAANREKGFQLYGCKRELKERYFQVSVMGEVTDEHLAGWLRAIRGLGVGKGGCKVTGPAN